MGLRLFLALSVLGWVGTVQAAAVCTHADSLDRPRIGLALGGGGARGISHIGVIRILEELRVPVDYVAGTSMGSIVGGFYATGMNSDELEATVNSVDWTELFKDQTDRADRTFRRKRDDDLSLYGPKFGVGSESELLPSGAISGQKIMLLFEEVAGSRVQIDHFDQLPIPFRAVATDIIDGEPVIIEDDNLAMAMRSSMSIPGIFAPVPYRDHLLVDGGIAKNLPVDVVRGMGADIVIAVDVGSPLHDADDLDNLLTITGQLSNILVQRNTMAQRAGLTEQDVLIVPNLGDKISSADFQKGEEAIGIGLEAGRGAVSELASLGVSEADYAAHRAGIEACVTGVPVIEFFELDNRSRFSDDVIARRLHVELGKPLDTQQMDADLAQVFALGFLERATYRVVEKDGRKGVAVTVEQDSRGGSFLETGLDLVGTSGSTTLDVNAAFLKTDVDKYGTEFRAGIQIGQNQKLFAELYKPFGANLHYILLPRLIASNSQVNTFNDNGDKIAQVEVQQVLGSLALGRELGRAAAIFAGVRGGSGELDVEVGPPASGTSFDRGEWFVQGTWDRLDDRMFPSTGQFLSVEHQFSRKGVGADVNFEQFQSSGFFVDTLKERHTLMAGIRYSTTVDGTAPVQSLVRAGGLFNMSGFEPNELTGQHYGLGLLGYRFRLKDRPILPPNIGATIEYGNATNDRDDIIDNGIWNGSLYVGFGSPIGPIYAGYGWREHDSGVIFVRIGTIFTNGQSR